MIHNKNFWSKKELQIYILLLCANADQVESKKEIKLIKSKTDAATFERLYNEFKRDTEDESLEKINLNIQQHEYSHMELMEFRKEMDAVFLADKKFGMMERNLNRILDNIIY